VDEARQVLDRIDRIERLRREGAAPAVLLTELRGLVRDAERWVEREGAGTEAAARALAECRRALAQGRVPLVAR
jgi:hypothetical protein